MVTSTNRPGKTPGWSPSKSRIRRIPIMTGMNGSPQSVMPPIQPRGIWTAKAASWGSSATMPVSASISARPSSPGWKGIHPTPIGQSRRLTGRVSHGAPGMGQPWPRFITISSCRWPVCAINGPRCGGESRISSIAFSVSPRGCGWRKPPWIWKHWRCWPRRKSVSPSSLPTRRDGFGGLEPASGRMSPAHVSTLRRPTSAGFPRGEVSPSSSTTALFPKQWPSRSC